MLICLNFRYLDDNVKMNKKGLVYESNEGKRLEMIGDEEKKE